MNERPSPEKRATDEIDISDFLRLIGRAFTRFGLFIKSIFVTLYNLVIFFLIFIKRSFVILLIGSLIGAGIAAYIYYTAKPRYSSSMTVRSNFDNNYFLYNQIEYYNALIRNRRADDLAKELNLTPAEALDLTSFGIGPIKNEYEAAQLYRDAFLRYKTYSLQADSNWAKTMKFDEFKKTLADVDYPLQQITVQSRRADVYARIQEGIFKAANNNPELQKKKQAELQAIVVEDSILTESLRNIDTLRQIYNKTLTLEATKASPGTNQLILGEANRQSPELELYDKSIMIKDDLIELKKKSARQMELLQIYSGFNKLGTRASSVYIPSMIILYAFLGTLALLILLEFIRYLSRVEKSKLNGGVHTGS